MPRRNKHLPQFHKSSCWSAGMTEEEARKASEPLRRRRHGIFARMEAPTPRTLKSAQDRRKVYMHSAARQNEALKAVAALGSRFFTTGI